jgi:hypothetical protein
MLILTLLYILHCVAVFMIAPVHKLTRGHVVAGVTIGFSVSVLMLWSAYRVRGGAGLTIAIVLSLICVAGGSISALFAASVKPVPHVKFIVLEATIVLWGIFVLGVMCYAASVRQNAVNRRQKGDPDNP